MTLTILDLGGVLYDIDFERTRSAFTALPGYNGAPILFGVENQDPLFVSYDRGDVSTQEFIDALRSNYGFTCSDQEIEAAWCAILEKGLFPNALDFVESIRNTYATTPGSRLVLFSNISELHHLYCASICAPIFSAVDRVYLSYKEHVRKPDPAAFLHVCASEGFAPSNSMLIDDSMANCESARGLGMKAMWKKRF